MNDESAKPTDPGGTSRSEPSPDPVPDVPVGDMTEEGETELGPYPSLTHLENLRQADLDAAKRDDDTGDDYAGDDDTGSGANPGR